MFNFFKEGPQKEAAVLAAAALLATGAIEAKNAADAGLEPQEVASHGVGAPMPGSIEASVADHIKDPSQPIVIPATTPGAAQEPVNISLNEAPIDVHVEGSGETPVTVELNEAPIYVKLEEEPIHVDKIEN